MNRTRMSVPAIRPTAADMRSVPNQKPSLALINIVLLGFAIAPKSYCGSVGRSGKVCRRKALICLNSHSPLGSASRFLRH